MIQQRFFKFGEPGFFRGFAAHHAAIIPVAVRPLSPIADIAITAGLKISLQFIQNINNLCFAAAFVFIFHKQVINPAAGSGGQHSAITFYGGGFGFLLLFFQLRIPLLSSQRNITAFGFNQIMNQSQLQHSGQIDFCLQIRKYRHCQISRFQNMRGIILRPAVG